MNKKFWLRLLGENPDSDKPASDDRFRETAAILITVAVGLAIFELWALSSIYGANRYLGPIIGAVCVGVLTALPAVMKDTPGQWARGSVAALSTVIEVVLSLAVAGTLSAAAVSLLPESVGNLLFKSDRVNELIILTGLGMGMVVAARGWLKFSTQLRRATQATVDVERARAQTAERERELARAELTVLRAQIEPHFLWNTLAHVKHLTRKSPQDAEAMTGHLIRFLRASVTDTRSNVTTLGAEMEAVEAYLELMKIRMGDRLSIHVDLDPGIASATFPPFLIQTLVENAIKHGIEPKVGPAWIRVRAGTKEVHTGHPDNEQALIVEVVDNGVGLMAAPLTKGTGLGLRNVRDRLRLLYGGEASLRIAGHPEGGVVASIQAPLAWSENETRAESQ